MRLPEKVFKKAELDVTGDSQTNEFVLIAKRDFATVLRLTCFLIIALLALSLLRWYGFSSWTIEDVTFLASTIQWPHTVPLAILIALIYFRRPLFELFGKTTEVGYGDRGIYMKFDPIQERRRELAKDSPKLKVDDVKELLRLVPEIKPRSVEDDSSLAHVWFLRNGITTRSMLEDLVRASEIFNILSKIYVAELGRNNGTPLDAIAVATWGSSLFIYGPRDDVIASITQQIRLSPEGVNYRERPSG